MDDAELKEQERFDRRVVREAATRAPCVNCGKMSGIKVWHAGAWYCPGACVVPTRTLSR